MADLDPDREFFIGVDTDNSAATATPNISTFVPTELVDMATDEDSGLTFFYKCIDTSPEHQSCPINCTSLEECMDCECAIVQLEDTGGPWGEVMDVIFCLLPIIYLLYATVKPTPTPTTKSLPLSAVIMFLVRVMYLGSNPLLTSACVIQGVHEAITPLSIMAGAITLFETMEATKCLPYMMREMKALTAGHPVAEVMLLFGFATLVEGASGFGTPVALGAPMLVSTGNPAMESVVIMLLFNTFATVWGAVGTPLWFGLGGLQLSQDDFLEISLRAATAMVFSAFILIPWVLTILVPFQVVKKNLIFLFLSIATVMGPVVGLASVNYEFPSLMGGLIGCGLTSLLIRFKIGLAEIDKEEIEIKEENPSNRIELGDLTDLADVTRGYHRAISDLTEAKPSSKPAEKEPSTQSAPADIGNNDNDEKAVSATEMTAEDENGDENKKKDPSSAASISNGHWDNVEVKQDTTKAEGDENRTVIFVNDNGVEQEVEKKVRDDNLEPVLAEEDAVKAQQSPEMSRQDVLDIVKQSATNKEDELLGPRKSMKEGYLFELLLRTFPIWGVVLLLILTRVQPIGIKGYLTQQEPYWEVNFGTYGDFRLSVSAVFQLRNILTYPGQNWKYELFYVPFLIPFVLISVLTMVLYRNDMSCSAKDIANTVVNRLSNPAIALMGALVLVQLMIRNNTESPAFILGVTLASWLREGFIVICPILGALGSFFSGSTTVSNLTFGEIQKIAAEEIGTSVNTMLALQTVGASAGNGICLNNIIAALAVVGLNVSEGQILMRTAKVVFSSTTIATVVMLAFFFRF